MAAPSTRLRLRVSPGARSNAIVGRHGEGWKVRVTAAPEGGKANDAVLRLLAERLDLPGNSLTLKSGPSSRDKRSGAPPRRCSGGSALRTTSQPPSSTSPARAS